MKIAVVGSPESGKSDFAESLKKELTKDGSKIAIVDDYVDDIAKESDLALGFWADWIGNLYVLLGRYAKERAASNEATTTITCGTLVETLVYASVDAVKHQNPEQLIRVQNFLHVLGAFYQDTWDYDHVFVLKKDDAEPESNIAKLNQHLLHGLDSLGVQHTLLEGTHEEKVKAALEELPDCLPCEEKKSEAKTAE
jgi:nicotinamide riboside kinase